MLLCTLSKVLFALNKLFANKVALYHSFLYIAVIYDMLNKSHSATFHIHKLTDSVINLPHDTEISKSKCQLTYSDRDQL